MSPSNVHLLHPPPPPLAAYLRVGHTGHHKLEALYAANRLGFRRLVFDAAYVGSQGDCLRLLKAAGSEIVLDLNAADTAMPGRFASAVSKLPWGNPDRPWLPTDFGPGRNDDFCKRMADFVVRTGADAVLAPTHAVGDDDWHAVDRSSCERLRFELDRVAGRDVVIDYSLVISGRDLRDPSRRAIAVDGVADLPVQNVWLRVSGFGASATGAGTRSLIEAVRNLHELGRPLVIDMAGGFAGLSTLAFGAVGGISHGVAQREGFDLAVWRKPPGKRGGSSLRAYIPELDRYLNEEQAKIFFAARGTKARFACNDTGCCRNGIDDMLENGHAHFVTQRSRQLEHLGRVPEGRRAELFLLHDLDPAVRSTRQAAKLKFADDGVQKLVNDAKFRLTRLRDALGALHEADAGSVVHSRAPIFRGGHGSKGKIAAVVGRLP
jgi:hypothetical protein